MWKNIPCDCVSKKILDKTYVHNYDFGVMEFTKAKELFSPFCAADVAIGDIEKRFCDDVQCLGTTDLNLNFRFIREGDKVHVTLKRYETVLNRPSTK